jgi:ABC-type glycerol-3-phosphate transport system permease component
MTESQTLLVASISNIIGPVHPFHKAEDEMAAAGRPLFGIYLMRASVAGIPKELYESARCDGAGACTEVWRSTLPLRLPGLARLAVLSFVGTWNSYLWPRVIIKIA